MSTNKKTYKNQSNPQEKLANMEHSFEADNAGINHQHNTKKESLGPNTKR